jgi:phosphoribosyl 1,2-cyclic phosphodiesterase
MSNTEPSHPYYIAQPQSQFQQSKPPITVQFWGVRGLIPAPGNNTARYGGNTASVEIQVAGKHLIFDGGTGLRLLGKSWQLQQPIEAYLFFTNSQLNRIQGFPFFAPAFVAENALHIYGTAASNGASIKQCLCDQMLQPHFPYPLQVMQSDLQFFNFIPGEVITLDDITITTVLIHQTHKSIGYRISWQEYSVAYVTDLQADVDELDQEKIAQLIQGVDLLVANAAYSTQTTAYHNLSDLYSHIVDLAVKGNVKQLVISHYHPDHCDNYLDQVQEKLISVFPKALLAREDLVLSVGG